MKSIHVIRASKVPMCDEMGKKSGISCGRPKYSEHPRDGKDAGASLLDVNVKRNMISVPQTDVNMRGPRTQRDRSGTKG